MKAESTYDTLLSHPFAGLLKVFSIDFCESDLEGYPGGPMYLLFCVEHLASCPITYATLDATADTVFPFKQGEILHFCGAARIVVSKRQLLYSTNFGLFYKKY